MLLISDKMPDFTNFLTKSWCFVVLIAIGLVLRLALVWTYRLTIHPLAKYPGPWLAKVSDLYGAYHNVKGQLHTQTEIGHQKYGKVFRQGPNKLVFNSVESLHEIYYAKSEVQKSYGYETMIPAPGAYNIFTAVDKNIHRLKRKLLSYGFADTAIKAFEPKMLHHIDIFVRKMIKTSTSTDGQVEWSIPLDMTACCRHLQYDVMGEFGFGQSFQLQTKIDNHFLIDAVTATSRKAGVYVQYPKLALLQLDKLLYRKGMEMRAKYLRLMADLVKSRVAQGEDSQVDLFSHLVNAKDPETGRGFTEDELWAESRFLLIAGADTSSTGLAGAFFYLTAYPECYERLAQEIRGTFTSGEDIKTGPTLAGCTYLRACIDEMMRMSPPISGTLWREVCPGGITLEGEYIPAGTDIGVNPYAVHHNDDLYSDSHIFKPERWIVSDENSREAVDRARFAFSPFSLGSRSCAGRNMAYMELTNALAKTIWYTDFRRADGDLGGIAEGINGDARDGRHTRKEFQLREHLTCAHDGPFVQFRPREGVVDELLGGRD